MKKRKLNKKINPAPFYSIALAAIIGAVIILASGNSPLTIYSKLIVGAFGSGNGLQQMLLQTTPLLFCGLSVAVSMKCGLLNLGVEGQLYMGALASAATGIYFQGLPQWLHIPLCILAGMAGGALWAFLPVWLKIKRGTHEVVTALMLNYIAVLFIEFMVNYPMGDRNSSVAQTDVLPSSATLPKLFIKSQVSVGIIIGIVLAVILAFVFKQTILGFQITLTGAGIKAAAASGVNVNRIMIVTMIISGVCSGLAGTVEVMGTYNRLIQGFSPGYGFDGIAVAVLGGSPVTVIFSALLFGALRAGGMALNFGTNLSVKFITTLQGIIILLIAAPELSENIWRKLRKYFAKIKKREG